MAIGALTTALLSRIGPTVEVDKTLYYSPVWSPDAKSIAYVKRTMKYAYTDALLDLPVLTPERALSFQKDSLELVVNELGGAGERVIKKFDVPKDKEDPADEGIVDVKLGWYLKGYLQYRLITSGFTKDLDTGNNFIFSDGKNDMFVSPSWDAKTKIVKSFPIIVGDKEIYPPGISRAVFEFDHSKKTVRLLVGDKRVRPPKYRPYTPPEEQ